MVTVSSVITAILSISGRIAKTKLERNQLVIQVLEKLGLKPDCIPPDFDSVYAYTLVEYGLDKPQPILKLFEQQEIRKGFNQAFSKNNFDQFLTVTKDYIEGYAIGDEIKALNIDYQAEVIEFNLLFIVNTRKSQNPKEFLFERLLEEIKSKLDDVLNRDDLIKQISTKSLSFQSKTELAQQTRKWFETLGYTFENYEKYTEDYFEFIINITVRRGYDRIFIRGVEGEASLSDFNAVTKLVETHKTHEGWIIARRRITSAARKQVENNDKIYCYTFDELIDQNANFSKYFDWLEEYIKLRKIDSLYVPLACRKDEVDPYTQQKLGISIYGEQEGWIEGYIERWLDDPVKEHISILGEFGTGKTWFVFHYAWETLQKYKEAQEKGIQRPRLPLVIPLRDYAKAVTVESLLSEFCFRKHEIGLPGYSAFDQLNRMGKLLLIFDGFDEMAAKVDRQAMINNFWELAKVIVPGAKAILTCRNEHFPEAKEGRSLLSAELKASTSNLTGEPPQFEILELEKFSDEQIRKGLEKQTNSDVIERIMSNSELLDLARRPLMGGLILEALPEIEAGKPIDISRIYWYAVRRKMERDIKDERTFTGIADKLYFMCELAYEMLSTDQMSLNYRLFPERIRRLFKPEVQEQKDLDHWHYDMMGQTLLIRNSEGDYKPAHRSLLEFFVAYKFAVELGLLATDFYQEGDLKRFDLRMFDLPISPSPHLPISPFNEMDMRGDLTHLVQTFGKQPLTKAVLDLLMPMLAPGEQTEKQLEELVSSTQGRTAEEVGYIGGNVVNLLLNISASSLKEKDLSETVIRGVDFTKANLAKVNFTGADLTDSQFANLLGGVWKVAFSPDGQLLATGDDHGAIRLWNTANGQEVGAFEGHTSKITSIISRDGQTLISGSADHTVKLWDIKTGQCVRTFAGHTREVNSVAMSEDGTILASGSADTTVKIWNATTKQCDHTLQGHTGEVNSVALSGDGKILASGSADTTVKIWNTTTKQCDHTLQGHTRAVNSVALSRDGQTLASGGADTNVRLWDTKTGNCLEVFSDNIHVINSVALSEDGTKLASGVVNATVKCWNTRPKRLLFSRQGNMSRIDSVALSEDGNILASSSANAVVKLWESNTATENSLPENTSRVYSVALSGDGQKLATGSDNRTVKLWDRQDRKCLKTFSFDGGQGWVRAVALSGDGQKLAAGSDNQTVKLWDTETEECVTFTGHSNWVRAVALSRDGKILVSGSADHAVKLWDTERGNCLFTFNEHNGGHTGGVMSVALSDDGEILASGSADTTVKIWNTKTKKPLFNCQGHTSEVRSVALSGDGKILASGSFDETIKLWDVKTGECLKTLDNRPYVGMNITGVKGLSEAEKATLKALGAVKL